MLSNILPASLRGYSKFLVPAIGTVLAVVVDSLVTGHFSRVQLAVAITGLGSAFGAAVLANATGGVFKAAKALLPALGTVGATLVLAFEHGVFDRTATATALTGLSSAVVIYLTGNAPLAHQIDGGSELTSTYQRPDAA